MSDWRQWSIDAMLKRAHEYGLMGSMWGLLLLAIAAGTLIEENSLPSEVRASVVTFIDSIEKASRFLMDPSLSEPPSSEGSPVLGTKDEDV